VGFAASRPGEYHTFLLTHSTAGSSIKPVAVNALDSFWDDDLPGDADDVPVVPRGADALPGWAG
jgi:hypothetical protein